jgi:hypothetical protein
VTKVVGPVEVKVGVVDVEGAGVPPAEGVVCVVVVVGVVTAAGGVAPGTGAGTVVVGGVITLHVCGLYCWQVDPPPAASATPAATSIPSIAANAAIANTDRPWRVLPDLLRVCLRLIVAPLSRVLMSKYEQLSDGTIPLVRM